MRDFLCKNRKKNVIYPLTYTAVYVIIIVSGGRYKIKAPDRKGKTMKTITLSAKTLKILKHSGWYSTLKYDYSYNRRTGEYKRSVANPYRDDDANSMLFYAYSMNWESINVKARK